MDTMTGAEQRALRRTPTALRGKAFPGGIDCVIKDFSQRGARLRFGGPPPTAARVLVVTWATGVAHEAIRCWGANGEAGYRFVDRFDLRRAVPAKWAEARAQWMERRPKLSRTQLKAAAVMIDYRGAPAAVRLS